VKFSDQSAEALGGLHPDARKEVRRALNDVAAGRARDVAGLTGRLAGFSRLRVGRHRVIFRYDPSGELVVEFLAPRSVVYEQFDPR